jgi:hypothetical protein
MSEALRPLVVNFEFQRKGKTAYITTGFAGFVGAFTGFRPVSIWYILILLSEASCMRCTLISQLFDTGFAKISGLCASGSYVPIRFSIVSYI